MRKKLFIEALKLHVVSIDSVPERHWGNLCNREVAFQLLGFQGKTILRMSIPKLKVSRLIWDS